MDCIVLTSDHTVFFAQFCWYLLPNHYYAKDLRLGTRCDVIIKVLSQTLITPTPRMVHTLIWGGHLVQAFIFGKFSNHYIASFQAISSFEQPVGWLRWTHFHFYAHLKTSFPPPVMPQNLQVHFQLTWWSAISQVFTSHWPCPIALKPCQQHNYEYTMLYPQSTTIQ